MRSKRSRSARRRVSATASGCSAKRAAIRRGRGRAPSSCCRGGPARTPPGSPAAGPRRGRPGGGRGGGRGSGRCRWPRWRPRAARRQLGEPAVAGAVAAPVGALQLDPEALAAEGGEQPPAQPLTALAVSPPLQGPGQQPVARAAREADEALGVLLHLLERRPRAAPRCARAVAGVGVGRGQQPAEVAVPGLALDQEGQVGAARPSSGQLGAGDRPHAELPAGERRTPSSPRRRRGR